MRSGKSHYFYIYDFPIKLLLAAILCFLTLNCVTKQPKQFCCFSDHFLNVFTSFSKRLLLNIFTSFSKQCPKACQNGFNSMTIDRLLKMY